MDREYSLETTLEKTIENITEMCSSERGEKLLAFIEAIGETYFTSPASSKITFHNCFPGGLAAHNLNVLNNLVKLNQAFDFGFSDETMCVVAILHDIGKTKNTDLEDYYQPTIENWKLKKGEEYEPTHGNIYMPTHQRTLWLCSHFGFQLTAEEYQAIATSDGMYIRENENYANKQSNLAIVLHMADMIAVSQEKN